MIEEYIEKTLTGTGDSDQHLLTLFSIALACKGKQYIELGVRSGTTTKPILQAVSRNGGFITDFCSMAKHNGYIKMRTDGSESRQLLYVDDCVEALEVLATRYYKLERDKNYHITSFQWNTIFEVASIIQNISSCGVEIGDRKDLTQMNAMNPPDPYIINYWRPKTSLVEGITKIYEAT